MKKQSSRPKRKKVVSPFAKNLEQVLKERDISQRAAAELAGVQVSVVNNWLSNSQPHDLSAVQCLCRALKVDFEFMLTGERTEQKVSDIPISEIFDVTDEPDFNGFFEISARRLRRKGGTRDD